MSPKELPSTTLWSTITSRIPTYSVSVKKDPQFVRNLFLEFQTWPNTQTSWRRHHRSLNRQDCDSFPAGIYIYSNSTVISDFCEQIWLCHLFLWRQTFTSPLFMVTNFHITSCCSGYFASCPEPRKTQTAVRCLGIRTVSTGPLSPWRWAGLFQPVVKRNEINKSAKFIHFN